MSLAADAYLETAFSIGVRLCRDAFWDGGRCNWQGPAVDVVDGRWALVQRTYGPDLYSGTSGIALFLSRLYRLTGEKPLQATARAALRQALSRAGDIEANSRLSFFCGTAGIAWAALELAEGGDPTLQDEGLALAESVSELDPGGHLLDLMAGIAGAIPAFLAIHRRCGGDRWLAAALRLGDHLLEKAHRHQLGWSWPNLEGAAHLTGFSHGSSGIAWVLVELAEATGEDRFRSGARQAFAHERRWFSSARENWPDLRDPMLLGSKAALAAAEPPYPVMWCHGAAGIGLARLRAWQLLGDAELRAEAEAAMRTTARSLQQQAGTAASFCLCHGQAGNAELFLYADQVSGGNASRLIADEVGRQGIECFEQRRLPWPSGVNGAKGEAPGLMLGTAGVGHFYLRLHDPAKTPPIVIPLPDALPG